MKVDSFKYLPRSFRPMYDDPEPKASEPTWAPFEKRLAQARIALLTSAGLYLEATQEPFDLERERQEPNWGDPTYRLIPQEVTTDDLGMTHLHVNNEHILEDHNVALPTEALDELVSRGWVGSAAPEHVSVMGYQGWTDDRLRRWREETAPKLIGDLQGRETDGVVLAPV